MAIFQMLGAGMLLLAAAGAMPGITKPQQSGYLRGPAASEIEAAWPDGAHKEGIAGRAAMSCKPDSQGELNACKVILDEPAEKGFGSALLSLAPLYRLKSSTSLEDDRRIYVDWFSYDEPADWISRPSGSDVMIVFPTEAARLGIGGTTVMSCLVEDTGGLSSCTVIYENPGELGFGAAALRLASKFRFHPAKLNGRPVMSAVAIPVTFRTPNRILDPASAEH